METIRRQLLATSAVVGTGMLAGCEMIPFLGGGGGVGKLSDWTPAAGETSDSDTIQLRAQSPSQIHSNRNNLHPNRYRRFQSSNRTGVEWKLINMSLSFENGTVYTGSFNVDEVESELESATGADDKGKYSRETTEGDYNIYISDSVDSADNAR